VISQLSIDSPVGLVKSVDEKKHIPKLAKLGIRTVGDLLLHLPLGWEDFEVHNRVSQMTPGAEVTFTGTVHSIQRKVTKNRRLAMAEAVVRDEEGNRLHVVWFHQAKVAYRYRPGDRIALAGKVTRNGYTG